MSTSGTIIAKTPSGYQVASLDEASRPHVGIGLSNCDSLVIVGSNIS